MNAATLIRRSLAAAALAGAMIAAPAFADPIEIDIPFVNLQTTTPTDMTLTIGGDLTGPDNVTLVGVPSPGTGEEASVLVTMTTSGSATSPLAVSVIAQHTVQNAADNMIDTVIQFNTTGTLVNIGDSTTVDVEIVAMNLVGINPVEVDLGGGSQIFDVFVGLDPFATQQQGTMTFTRTGKNTMSFDISLPEALLITLVEQGNPTNQIFVQHEFTFEGTGGLVVLPDFSAPAPAGLGLTGLGLIALGALRRRKAA
jgi:hypothetical protein